MRRDWCDRWCRRESRLSIEFPLYITTNAFSHVHVTSCLEAECVSSTLACWRNEWLAWNFLREAPFPILWRRYIVSHPRTAYRKNMCWHMSGPRLCFVTLMFQMCGCFVVFFGSGQRKRSCDSMLECSVLARNEEFSKIAVINFFLQFSKKKYSYLWGGFCGGNFEIYHANQQFSTCMLIDTHVCKQTRKIHDQSSTRLRMLLYAHMFTYLGLLR